MSLSPEEILQYAEALIAPATGDRSAEVVLRCSTSRAYYAALHAADECLPADISPGLAERKGRSSHQAIIDAMILWSKAVRPGRSEARVVARSLPRLRDARKKADYKVMEDYTIHEADSALFIAKQIIISATRAAQQAAELQA